MRIIEFRKGDNIVREKEAFEKSKILSKDDKIMIRQSRMGEKWHGVSVYELSELAGTLPRGRYVEVKNDRLYFYYSRKITKLKKYVDFEWDERRKEMKYVEYEYDNRNELADEFLKLVNEKYFPHKPEEVEEFGGILGKILSFLDWFFNAKPQKRK